MACASPTCSQPVGSSRGGHGQQWSHHDGVSESQDRGPAPPQVAGSRGSKGGGGRPASPAATAAAAPAYMSGAPEAFMRQADVLFVPGTATPDGDSWALPAHSQLLARCCTLFADLLDCTAGSTITAAPSPLAAAAASLSRAAAGEDARAGTGAGKERPAAAPTSPQPTWVLAPGGRPCAAAPLRVPLQGHATAQVELLLQAVYHPHCISGAVASLHDAAAYGALADLAAFCG